MSPASAGRRVLVVGGTGGLIGRAVLREFARDWTIRSVHRHRVPAENVPGVEWVAGDAATIPDWGPLLRDVDVVLNLAWYRHGAERRFRALADGLLRLLTSAEAAGVRRWVQVSVPEAPASLEHGLPYLVHKRRVDSAVAAGRLPYAIVRPSMVFGPSDKLVTVMVRTVARYHRLPLFGDGQYHLSPIAATDVARALRREAEAGESRTVEAGGPRRWGYLELTARMFEAMGRPARYVRFSPAGGIRLARFLEWLGSSLLYAYEVEWLLSDRLGSPAYEGLDPPLLSVEPFLESEARRYGPTPATARRRI